MAKEVESRRVEIQLVLLSTEKRDAQLESLEDTSSIMFQVRVKVTQRLSLRRRICFSMVIVGTAPFQAIYPNTNACVEQAGVLVMTTSRSCTLAHP
jgi:hypothetical protein